MIATVKVASEALLLHLRDQERADAGGVGRGGARDAGEEHADQDVDVAEPARQMADHGPGEVDQAIGDAGRVHQVGGQQEEGDGQQHEGVVGLEHLAEEQERRQRGRR